MSEHKHTATNRLLAWLLTVVMLLSMVPTTAFAAGGSGGPPSSTVTLKVFDPKESALKGATVSYKINAQQNASTATTDNDGIASIDLSNYFRNDVDSVTLKYTVSMDGYVTTAEATATITRDDLGKQLAKVEMAYAGYKVTIASITPDAGEVTHNGTANEDGTIFVQAGGEPLTLTAVANEGYQIDSITATPDEGKNITIKDDTVTITAPETMTERKDVTVSVTFVRVYEITVKYDNKTGSVTANGASSEDFKDGTGTVTVAANKDGKIEIVATPKETYRVSEVKIGGIAVTDLKVENNGGYETTLKPENYTIEVTFAPNEYTVTAEYAEGQGTAQGTIAVPAEKVPHGQTATVTITPAEGYEIASVKVNGTEKKDKLNEKNELKLTITADTTVTVTFAKKTYKVTVNCGIGGYAYIKNENQTPTTLGVQHGDPATVIIQPDSSYNINDVTENTTDVTSKVSYAENTGYTYTIDEVVEDIQVEVTFGLAGNADVRKVSFGDYCRKDDTKHTYVYKKNATATISTTANGIKVVNTNEQTLFGNDKTVYGGYNSTSFTVINDVTFDGTPYVLKVREGWANWKVFPTVKILFDDIDPTVSVNDKDSTETTLYFPDNTTLPVTASDAPGDGKDTDKWTGISKIEYQIRAEGEDWPEAWTTLYTLGDDETAQETVTPEETIKVSCPTEDVTDGEGKVTGSNMVYGTKYVRVKATDKAGNAGKDDLYTYTLVFNPTLPELTDSTFEATKTGTDDNVWGKSDAYTSVTATFTVTDKTFNPKGLNFKGVYDKISITPKETTDGGKFEVKFEDGGEYNWTATYTSKTGQSVYVGEATFTIDNEAPTGKILVEEDKNYTWTEDWKENSAKYKFGLFTPDSVDVKINPEDNLSTIASVKYYTDYGEESLTWANLNDLYAADKKAAEGATLNFTEVSLNEEGAYKSVTVSEENRYAVYFRIEDAAGNYTYLCSNGIIIDETPLSVVLTPDEANANGAYGANRNNDLDTVNIQVKVDEPECDAEGNPLDTYSGIESVFYQIYVDGKPEPRVYMFPFENANPTYAELKSTWEGAITLNKADYNSSDVVVEVTAKDRAGNETTELVALDIDVAVPEIEVEYQNRYGQQLPSPYYGKRQASVTITERNNHFDAKAATAGIAIVAKDANEKVLGTVWTLSDWTTAEGETPDKATHTATITFNTDANYTLNVTYTDKAGNAAEEYSDSFTVDTTAPTGTVTAEIEKQEAGKWEQLIGENWSFKIKTNKDVTVTCEGTDATIGSFTTEYYLDYGDKALTDLKGIKNWTPYDSNNGINLSPDQQVTVYFKLTDPAGNVAYLSTNGMILDKKAPNDDGIAPQITAEPEQPINGFYNGNVTVKVNVTDPEAGDTYSGLKSVTYQVFNMDLPKKEQVTQTGTLYPTDEKAADRLKTLKDATIEVDAEKNNSNNVKVVITAVDNAGNKDTFTVYLAIDKTAPTIAVEYDNNEDIGGFYKENRTATITITERNFDKNKVKVTIKNTDDVIPAISEWKTVDGTGNGDNTMHQATITYDADGDYTFAIEYTDEAGNKCPGVTYADKTTHGDKFTIDKTKPVVSVAYNNNNAANGKYFNANRTATVTITEHNFDKDSVTWDIGYTRGGVEPQISWVNNGDIHTATIRYATDGDYTFGVSVTDKAGNKNGTVNYGNSVAGRDFVIDTTYADMITIGGVENGKAYGHDASVIPTITIADRNLNNYTVTLTGVQKGTTIDLTQKVNALLNAGSERVTGFLDIFEVVQDMDGIYTLSLTAQDRAGNRDAGEVTFTVNRFGSVYVYGEYLQTLIADGGAYVKSVTDDLVITEYNADKLLSGSLKLNVTCDGKPLENVDYSVTPEFNSVVAVGDSGWYQYRYTISKSNFTADGVYKVSVSTEDATGNTPENNNYEDMGITFRVDNTQAEISSIIGLENAIINAPEAEIQYTVFDTMGIKSVKIYVDGVLVDEVTEFDSDLNNYTGSFTLGENSSAQSVRIVVEDLSGNITDTDAEGFSSAYEFNRTVTVSTNFFVRWYANKALFWGSIGAVAAAAVVWFLLAGKKKKKDEDTTK